MDQLILSRVNLTWTSPKLDLFMAAISCLELWIWPIAILGIAALIFGGFRARAAVITCLLMLGLADALVSNTLKHYVRRPRPAQMLADVRIVDLAHIHPRFLALFRPAKVVLSRPAEGPVEGESFPSSHTINHFCIAVVITAFYRRWGWLYFAVALLVAYSRLYDGAHWPSDVLASIFIGIGCGLVGIAFLESLWRRASPRFAPALSRRHPSLFQSLPA